MPHTYIYISKKFFFHNVHIGSLYGNVRYGYGMVRYCTVQMVKSTVRYGTLSDYISITQTLSEYLNIT